jgi:alkyl hydroperoxide reductase subunit AhpC
VRETIRLVQAFQSGQLTGCEWQPGEDYVVAA